MYSEKRYFIKNSNGTDTRYIKITQGCNFCNLLVVLWTCVVSGFFGRKCKNDHNCKYQSFKLVSELLFYQFALNHVDNLLLLLLFWAQVFSLYFSLLFFLYAKSYWFFFPITLVWIFETLFWVLAAVLWKR